MKFTRSNPISTALALVALLAVACRADEPATLPSAANGNLPSIHVDAKARTVAVECQALNVNIPLEFFCVTDGGNEHESVLRTPAKPSDIHFALLMLGLTPGEPATFVPARRLWIPPHGPPLHIECAYMLNGKPVKVPAYRMMRSIKTKKEMPPSIWVFDGSRVMPDGVYAADVTGYVVSICNFDLTMIDVPHMVSNANETLEWEFNPDLVPPKGTAVTMIIEPAAANEVIPAAEGVPAEGFNPGPGLSGDVPPATQPASTVEVPADQADVDQLRQRWDQDVLSHKDDLRQAAQAHREIIAALRKRQQSLIDEADRIQRTIDELEKQYQDMTAPLSKSATEPSGG
jgi:hypothetical protein